MTEPIPEKLKYTPIPPRPWIRAGYNEKGEQLWVHATAEQIKEAAKLGKPVHLVF